MNIFARIAQMESSRIVGGRAQTQALLRAPDRSRPVAATGNPPQPGARGEGTQTHPHAEIIRLPAGSIVSIPRFESLDAPDSNFYRGLMFATPVALFLWGFVMLVLWALFF